MLTPLMYASWKGQIGIVRELLDMGADVNGSVTGDAVQDSRSALSAALERSVVVIVTTLTMTVLGRTVVILCHTAVF